VDELKTTQLRLRLIAVTLPKLTLVGLHALRAVYKWCSH